MAIDFGSKTTTGVETIPASVTSTATAALNNTSNVISGTNMDALKVGDWIVSIANQERRKVISVDSPTSVTIHKPFDTAVGSAALTVVKADACAAVYMKLSGSGIVVDGVTTDEVEFGNVNNGGDSNKFIKPRFVNGTVTWNIEYFNNTYAD